MITFLIKRCKSIFFLLLVAVIIITGGHTYEAVKQQFLYPAVNKALENYCKENLKAGLFIGHMSGNLFTNLSLENVLLERFEGLPEGMALQVKKVHFTYTPLSLLMRKPKVEVSDLEFRYGKIILPLKFSQREEVITIHFDKRYFYFDRLERIPFLERQVILRGLLETKGILVFEHFKPKLFDVHFVGDNFEIIYADLLRARVTLNTSLKGERLVPHLVGTLKITDLEYAGEIGILNYKQLPIFKALEQFFVDISVDAANARIRNKSLDAVFNINLQIKKEPKNQPYLIGTLQSRKGRYAAYQNKFRITKGIVLFKGNHGEEAIIDIAALAKVKRYQITATSKGTLKDSRLELTSRPRLPRDEIIALLLFGKRTGELNVSEKNTLLGTPEVAVSLLDKLFLGKAEAKIAELVGIDELHVRPKVSADAIRPQLPEVEIGKYLNGDKIYGSYKVQPPQEANGKSIQTTSGEYNVNENLKIKGQRSFADSIKLPQEDKVEVEFKWRF